MAKSTGIVLTATAISMGNDWLQTHDLNFRMGMAGLAFALVADGIEHIDQGAGVGIAYIMLITSLLTPFNGKAPSQTVLDLLGGNRSFAAPSSAVPRSSNVPRSIQPHRTSTTIKTGG